MHTQKHDRSDNLTTSPRPSMPASNSARQRTKRVEHFDTIVIGGGQAGLAVGHHLAKRDADFIILDAGSRTGDAWRQRWDSLRLFTPARYSGLPGLRFPADPGHLPDKDEVADYLERYADRFDLPIRFGARAGSLARDGSRYVLEAGGASYQANHVVVATGPFQRPRVPDLAARIRPDIVQLHSSEYRNPFLLPDGEVLVVGAGNSGAQIAMELGRFRKVWLAGKESGRLPRRLLGRDVYDWVWPLLTRFSLDTAPGRRIQLRTSRADPLVGISAADITAAGARRVGRVTGQRDGLPECDGEVITPRVIIWCTGFAPDYSWIHLPVLDSNGNPQHRRGIATGADGLYFAGLRFQYRMTSALLGGVGLDAEFIADDIARREMLDAAA